MYYPHIKPVIRHSVNLPLNLNPYWVSGFVSGDGGFSIIIRPSKSYILKQQVSCRFHIAQHIRDIELMDLFSKFFNCGTVYVRTNSSERCDFVVQDINLLISKIIPHFDIYPILNLKYKDYICFKKALNIIHRDAASRRTQETHTLWKKMEEGLPVCAMHGTDDMLVDGNSLDRELRKHAKNLDIKIVDGAGHALFWEMPDETAEVIVQFAKKVWKRVSKASFR